MMKEQKNAFRLDPQLGYFRNEGVNIMAFDDIYPEGHQSGVSILMHGRRIATCGDVRFEPTPGQWQPIPGQLSREVDEEGQTIVTRLEYPNEANNLKGQNPKLYPDAELKYTVRVRGEGESVLVSVDWDAPVPESLQDRVCFNLELFPGAMFGQPWIMDGQNGVFPRQPNGPLRRRKSLMPESGHHRPDPAGGPYADRNLLLGDGKTYNPIAADDWIAEPYCTGKKLTVCADDPLTRLTVECLTPETELELYDGRMLADHASCGTGVALSLGDPGLPGRIPSGTAEDGCAGDGCRNGMPRGDGAVPSDAGGGGKGRRICCTSLGPVSALPVRARGFFRRPGGGPLPAALRRRGFKPVPDQPGYL